MHFLYFTDPMCSWCYGFGPVVRRLADTFAPDIGLQVVPGGLRPHETRAMSPARAAELLHHWDTVADETGRPFDKTFFARHPGYVYDTYPASRAVAAVNALAPDKGLDFLDELQQAFYARGEDPKREDVQARAAEAVGVAPDRFSAALADPAVEAATQGGFERFQGFGGMGFPFLLLQTAERPRIVTIGYQPYEMLDGVVRNIVAKLAPQPPVH